MCRMRRYLGAISPKKLAYGVSAYSAPLSPLQMITMFSAASPHLYDIIRIPNCIQIMLNYNHHRAQIIKILEHYEQHLNIQQMQS